VQHTLVLLHTRRPALARRDPGLATALATIGVIDRGDRLEQALPLLAGHALEDGAVLRDGFEEFDRVAQAFQEFGGCLGHLDQPNLNPCVADAGAAG
jgi:hypothetical protein